MRATFSAGRSSLLLLHSAGLSVAERPHTMTSNYKPVAVIDQPGSSSSSQTSVNSYCRSLYVVVPPPATPPSPPCGKFTVLGHCWNITFTDDVFQFGNLAFLKLKSEFLQYI